MSDLKVLLYDDAKDFLEALPIKRRQQVARKILALVKDEPSAQSKGLVGFEPLRRLRSGDYRIVYFVESETLHVVFIDNRNDDKVYRKVLRKMR